MYGQNKSIGKEELLTSGEDALKETVHQTNLHPLHSVTILSFTHVVLNLYEKIF